MDLKDSLGFISLPLPFIPSDGLGQGLEDWMALETLRTLSSVLTLLFIMYTA